TEDENSSTDGFNTFDASLVVGLGLDLPMGLTARASYDWGFMPVLNTSEDGDDSKIHNATIKISLGLMF
ncbi:MAG: PorT family protein, partial [Bacteroidales bacterium]|nr:PorT family protein [Bacteroidales bacterium]